MSDLFRAVMGALRSFADAHPEALTPEGRGLLGSAAKRICGAVDPVMESHVSASVCAGLRKMSEGEDAAPEL